LASTKSGSADAAEGSGEKERSSAREEEKKREAEMRREESSTDASSGAAHRRCAWAADADAEPGDGGFDSIIAAPLSSPGGRRKDRDQSPGGGGRGGGGGAGIKCARRRLVLACWRVAEGRGVVVRSPLCRKGLASHERG
jgi:hypothetical protein